MFSTQKLRTAVIGIPPGFVPNSEAVILLSDQHLSHYDLFVVTLEGVLGELLGGQVSNGEKTLGIHQETLSKKRPLLEKRLKEVLDLVHSGSVLLVFVGFPLPSVRITMDAGKSEYLNQSWAWFLEGVAFKALAGSAAEYCGPVLDPIPFGPPVAYAAEINCKDTTSIFRAPSKLQGQNKTVGLAKKYGEGSVMFLPRPYYFRELGVKPGPELAVFREIFLNDAMRVARAIDNKPADLPAWTGNYLVKEDAALSKKAADIKQEIRRLAEAQSTTLSELSQSLWKYQLLSASGSVLEGAVKMGLEALGFKVATGPPGRADLVAVRGEMLVVCEVKGFSGAAGENAVRQCATWLAETDLLLHDPEAAASPVLAQYRGLLKELGCLDDAGEVVAGLRLKGMIICNTFRERELKDRPSPGDTAQHFPNVFQDKLKHGGFVALTTVQLLGFLAAALKAVPETEITTLLECKGVYEGYLDWTAYLAPA